MHEKYCEEIRSVLTHAGFRTIPFGIEHRFSRECHLLLLEHRSTGLSKFARFVPDYILVATGGLTFFDVKSPSTKYHNIAIELDAMDNYRTLSDCNMPVFIVARDHITFWATDVFFSKVFDDRKTLRANNGSSTPFGIVDLEATQHCGMLEFVEKFKVKED